MRKHEDESLQNGLFEILVFRTLNSLFELKSATIFKYPVNPQLQPNYASIIHNPMDISTIIHKFSRSKYSLLEQIHKDFELIVENCLTYNKQCEKIKNLALRFQASVNKGWDILLKELEKEGISYRRPIKITKEVLKKFNEILKKHRQNSFMELKRLSPEAYDSVMKDKRSAIFQGKQLIIVDNQNSEHQGEKQELFLQKKQILVELVNESARKNRKYEKLVKNNVVWIGNLILFIFVHDKNLRKTSSLEYLKALSEKVIEEKIQLMQVFQYLLFVSQWMRQYQNIFSLQLRIKFFDCYKSIAKSVSQIKHDRNEKINSEDFSRIIPSMSKGFIIFRRKISKNDEIILKDFLQMLEMDKQKVPKQNICYHFKETESGQIQVIEEFQPGSILKQKEKERQDIEKGRQYNDEDINLIGKYRQKSNGIIVKKYGKRMEIDWDKIIKREGKVSKKVQLNFNVKNIDK